MKTNCYTHRSPRIGAPIPKDRCSIYRALYCRPGIRSWSTRKQTSAYLPCFEGVPKARYTTRPESLYLASASSSQEPQLSLDLSLFPFICQLNLLILQIQMSHYQGTIGNTWKTRGNIYSCLTMQKLLHISLVKVSQRKTIHFQENDLLQKPWKRGGDRACKKTG